MNIVMRRLAALSAIFLPLTLISGIMGMNVQVPGMIGFPNTPPGLGWFIGVLVFMVILGLGIALFFKWKRWL
jgi:Mg2+ and Co2+ transporter CorA